MDEIREFVGQGVDPVRLATEEETPEELLPSGKYAVLEWFCPACRISTTKWHFCHKLPAAVPADRLQSAPVKD